MKGCCYSCKHWERLDSESKMGKCKLLSVFTAFITQVDDICAKYYGSNWDRLKPGEGER